MATWVGWQAQFLEAAGLPTDEAVQNLLFDWSQHAASSCRNNPIDVSRAASGASNCHRLTASRTAKNYTSHGQAASAFAHEINSGNFPHLLAQLGFADPYEAPSVSAVTAELRKWGSPAFASFFQAHAHSGSGSGGGGGGGGPGEPHVHKGWADLARSLNSRAPRALSRSSHLVRQALRASSHGGRVRH